MQDQINLNEITDENELNKLYVQTSERILQLNQALQEQQQNHQAIRARMNQLQEEKVPTKKEKTQ